MIRTEFYKCDGVRYIMAVYYKSMRWVNGKLTRIIKDDDDNIIQNLTKEQIKMAILEQ